MEKKIKESPEKVTIENIDKLQNTLNTFQKFLDSVNRDINIDAGRLLGLCDGIFGMVMTLLIFGISLPDAEITTYPLFISFMSQLAPTIGVTIVSFILIASLWVYHHEFIRLTRFNFVYLWINVLFLLFVSFIPFTTSLIGNYSHFFLSEVIFGLNIFLALSSFILMYYYADKMEFLENKQTINEKRYTMHTFASLMGLTIIVNLLDYFVSPSFIYLFLLMPFISTFRDIYKKFKV